MDYLLFTLMSSVLGVSVIAAFDSTMIVFLPLAVDIGMILITSHHPDLFWLYAILISASSIIGAAATFYIGRRMGETGLERFVSARRLQRIKARLKGNRAIAIAALDLIPPPFPFTAFIVTAGALKVSIVRFFVAMFAFRLIRFGAEGVLAAIYGQHIIRWMQSDLFRYMAWFFTLIVVAGSVFTAIQFMGKRGRGSTLQA